MTKFKALVQFSYNDTMYNPRREAYELNDDVVQEWDKEGYVKIVGEEVQADKIAKEE